jgi:hypothetical protein
LSTSPICAEEAMPLSSTTTPKACFPRLWKLLSVPKPELWREYRAAAQGPKRQREALELLASVVWHLELAHSLAPWPTQKMEEFYSELLCRQPDWLEAQGWVSAARTRLRFLRVRGPGVTQRDGRAQGQLFARPCGSAIAKIQSLIRREENHDSRNARSRRPSAKPWRRASSRATRNSLPRARLRSAASACRTRSKARSH